MDELKITSEDLPRAELGVAYDAQLASEGGAQPHYFSIHDGRLPRGLSLDGHGRITGTPEQIGEAILTFRCDDGTLKRSVFKDILFESVNADALAEVRVIEEPEENLDEIRARAAAAAAKEQRDQLAAEQAEQAARDAAAAAFGPTGSENQPEPVLGDPGATAGPLEVADLGGDAEPGPDGGISGSLNDSNAAATTLDDELGIDLSEPGTDAGDGALAPSQETANEAADAEAAEQPAV